MQPDQIERRIKTRDGRDVLLFHTGWSILSSFYCSPFIIDGQKYQNAEQYYQVQKAKYFADAKLVCEMLTTRSPRQCKELGKNVENFNMQEWLNVAEKTMLIGITEKFLQNTSARTFLKSTTGSILAEATRFDSYWANGLDISDTNNEDIDNWPGKNLLGKMLMYIRDTVLP